MPDPTITLECLYTLDIIIRTIREHSPSLSRTSLKNSLGLNDAILTASLDYGCSSNHLIRGEYNVYSVIKDFSIPEERFYPSVNVGLSTLWTADKYEANEFYIEETARKDSKIAGPWTQGCSLLR
jgi:hypothetical protein